MRETVREEKLGEGQAKREVTAGAWQPHWGFPLSRVNEIKLGCLDKEMPWPTLLLLINCTKCKAVLSVQFGLGPGCWTALGLGFQHRSRLYEQKQSSIQPRIGSVATEGSLAKEKPMEHRAFQS